MQFTNLNIYSILIFLFFLLLAIILLIFYSRRYKKNSKIYYLLYKKKSFKNYFLVNLSLFLAIFILLFWIFWIKYKTNKKNFSAKWLDIVFVLDVSKSMNAIDMNWTTRLWFAKNMIKNYIAKHNYNRYWLIIFSWDAMSIAPLTTDYSIFLSFLDSVNYKNLYSLWTNFYKWLKLAFDRFWKDNTNPKAIIFISDWADKDTKIKWEKIKKLKSNNIFLWVVWVWTTSWAKILESYDIFWDPIYTQYKQKDVIVKLNEENLKKLAKIFDWEYYSSLNHIDKNLDLLEKKVIMNKNSKNFLDFTRFLILFSFFFFIIYLFFSKWK